MLNDRESWLALLVSHKDSIVTALLILLAGVGGLIGSLIRQVDTERGVRWTLVALETMASAFSGVLVILLCQALGMSLQMTGVIVGVCGWVGGHTTMIWLEKRVRRVLEGDTDGKG